MKQCCAKNKCGETAMATVADGALLVSLTQNDLPRTWRADMSRLSNAAFEVQETLGKFRLVLRAEGQAVEEIGVFADKAAAVSALQAVTSALARGDGKKSSCGGATGAGFSLGGFWRFFVGLVKVALWILLAAVLLMIARFVFMPRMAPPPGMGAISPPGAVAPVKPGVPVPLDQMLGE